MNDQSTTSVDHAGWNTQAFSKDCEFVSSTIAVSVFANLDSIATLSAWFKIVGIVDGFSDPKSATLIPRGAQRLTNFRLAYEQFE